MDNSMHQLIGGPDRVDSQSFENLNDANARFDELAGGDSAATLVDARYVELRHYSGWSLRACVIIWRPSDSVWKSRVPDLCLL